MNNKIIDINKILTKALESADVEAKICEAVEKSIVGSIESAFGNYSDFKRALEKKISDAVVLPDDVSLPNFNRLITESFAQIISTQEASAKEKIAREIESVASSLLANRESPCTMDEIGELFIEEMVEKVASTSCMCDEFDRNDMYEMQEFLESEGKDLSFELISMHMESDSPMMFLKIKGDGVFAYAHLYQYSAKEDGNKFSILSLTLGKNSFGGYGTENVAIAIGKIEHAGYKKLYGMFLSGTKIDLGESDLFERIEE